LWKMPADEPKEWPKHTMQSFLSILTALMLCVPAALGCCWHTAPVGSSHARADAVESIKQCTQHHHHHAADDHGRQHEPCPSSSYCTGACIYLPVQKVQIDAPQLVVAFYMAHDAAATMQMPSASDRGDRTLGSVESEPAVRLHLRNQVLLI
jgi:hypothetical protein